ncbi:hypothetical protein GQ44DRAFT_829447 [Phaeosphaeriaceae sp. PMI808]|nr:hypothetical protein GQ44DRAFT_829447 [Phaeosphaeriaceae sp. PMI808]
MILSKSVVVGLVSLSNLAAGAATPRSDSLAAAPAEAIEKRETNGANCWRHTDGLTSYWRISTWGVWDQDWGKGLLDNLKGSCGQFGSPNNWGFAFESGAPPTNGMASFRLSPAAYTSHCVLDAIWLASNGNGGAIWDAKCWESDKWWSE